MRERALTVFHLFSSARVFSSPREVLVSPQTNRYFPRLNISRFRRLSRNHCQFSAAFLQNHQHFKEKNNVRRGIYSKCSYFWCKLVTAERLQPELNRNDLEVTGFKSSSLPLPTTGWIQLLHALRIAIWSVSCQVEFLTSFCLICLLISVSTISTAVSDTSTLK